MRLLLLFTFILPLSILSQTVSLKHNLRMLALGDSYTIGESVAATQRWPIQLRDSLFTTGVVTDTMRIIATTGWRTDDLLNAISGQHLAQQNYNLVSLLIGVNNQYQGRPFSQYINEFPALLDSAVRYAGGDKSHVFVVSIPDYAFTPFGQQSSNPGQISAELDLYNQYSKRVADSLGITYINITPISREGVQKPAYVAGDGLHPSGVQYSEWVHLMLRYMNPEILTSITPVKNSDASKISIHPNPAKEYMNIGLRDLSPFGNHLELYALTGALVLRQPLTKTNSKIELIDLPKGLYFCKVFSGEDYIVKKIVVD